MCKNKIEQNNLASEMSRERSFNRDNGWSETNGQCRHILFSGINSFCFIRTMFLKTLRLIY